MRATLAAIFIACLATAPAGQVPQPFPKPGQPPPAQPAPAQPAPAATASQGAEPPEGSLGVVVYPAAQFLTSYDAGKGQRFYIYGTSASFAEIVQYYRTLLRNRGELVFDQPPIHQFDLGRFREETMGFPPSVTVKDYAWGGSAGYLNPNRGAQPARFPTIIQIVPNPSVITR